MTKKLTVKEVLEFFNLELINQQSAQVDLDRLIVVSDLHRPGIELAGYFNFYPSERIQILGKTELSFIDDLDSSLVRERIELLCQEDTPCIILTRELQVPRELQEIASENRIPLFRSKLSTTRFISKLTNYLEEQLAPTKTMSGVLVDVYGVGILIMGNSGIGKSETALELVKKGHRLVADDLVDLKRSAENVLIGTAPEIIRHILEIRGIGIIDVLRLFGAGAVKKYKKITLVVTLEMWDQTKEYDRLGLDEVKINILDVELPINTIPVRPGRNIAVIIEVMAMNYRLKSTGYNAAKEFTDRLAEKMKIDLD
ncbi:MAG: HPr(Ser) kinase/phosphatase [Vulcanibacillus sp.]